MTGLCILLGQHHVAHDRTEDVVEIMRDAAGERTDGLHLLGLAQLAFEFVALGFLIYAVNGDAHDVPRQLDQRQIGGSGSVRLTVIDGEGTHHFPVAAEDRRGPAGAQAVLKRQHAVVDPERVGVDVRDDDLSVEVCRRAARADLGPDGDTIHAVIEGVRQARCRAVPQVHPIGVHQENRTECVGQLLLQAEHQRIQELGRRGRAHDELEGAHLPIEQLLRPLALAEVAQKAGEPQRFARQARDREFQRKLRAVRAQAREFESAVQCPGFTGGHQAGEPVRVRLAQGRWDDDLRHQSAEHIIPPMAERPFRSRIEVHDPLRVIDRDDAFQRAVEDRAAVRVTCPRLRLRPLALRDVAHHDDEIFPIQLDQSGGHFDREQRAIFAAMLALQPDAAGGAHLPHDAVKGGWGHVRIDVRNGERQNLFIAVPQVQTTPRVHVEEAPGLGIDHLDRVVGVLELRAEQPQRLICLPTLVGLPLP